MEAGASTHARHWEDVRDGDEFTLTEETSSRRLVMWAGASGDFNPIHYDDQYARGNLLPDIIVHGALKGMLIGRLLEELCGRHGRVRRWDVSYRGMDIARLPLTIYARVSSIYVDGEHGLVNLTVGVRREDGTESTRGTATIQLPRRAEPSIK